MPESSFDALLRLARELLRPEALPAYEAGWEWLEPQMRSEEERCLAAATLLLLRPLQALVVPRRLAPGALASLHLTSTRSAPDGPVRRHLFVTVAPDDASPVEPPPDTLCFRAAEVRAAPLRCAALIVA